MNISRASWQPKPLQILAVLLVLQLFVTLFTDGFAMSFDEAMWHYIGRNWFRNGLVPYNGGVDNKSPLIFAIFGLSDRLFGVNYWFPRVLGTICQTVGIYYVYKIARHISNERVGLLAMPIYGLALLWHSTGGKYVSYTETYEVLFGLLAIHSYLTTKNSRHMFICGVFAAVALSFRLTGAFIILTIFISSFRGNPRYTFVFFTGVLTGIAALLLLGYVAGIHLYDMLTYGFLDNFTAGSPTDHTLVWKLHNFSAKFLMSGMLLFYPFVIGYFIIRRKFGFFGTWLLLAFVGICIIGIFDSVHLKEVLPPLAIMTGFCINYLIENYRVPAIVAVLFIAVMFFPNITEQTVIFRKMINREKETVQQFCAKPFTIPDEGSRKQLGWWIKDNTSPDDKVYIAGFSAQVQAYSERISPTIYFNATQTPLAKERLYADLKDGKPKLILVPLFPEYKQTVSADMRNFVDTLIARNYQLKGCQFNYSVFQLKPSP